MIAKFRHVVIVSFFLIILLWSGKYLAYTPPEKLFTYYGESIVLYYSEYIFFTVFSITILYGYWKKIKWTMFLYWVVTIATWAVLIFKVVAHPDFPFYIGKYDGLAIFLFIVLPLTIGLLLRKRIY